MRQKHEEWYIQRFSLDLLAFARVAFSNIHLYYDATSGKHCLRMTYI